MRKFIVILLAIIFVFISYGKLVKADCFDKAYNSGPVKEVTIRPKVHRTDLGCSSFNCVVERAPSSRRILHVYLGSGLPNRVLWGNAGWEKSVATARTSNAARIKIKRKLNALIRNALVLSLGVELDSLVSRPDLIEGDRDFHDRFAFEANCDNRKKPGSVSSFNESVKIPKKNWAAIRRGEGWFDGGE